VQSPILVRMHEPNAVAKSADVVEHAAQLDSILQDALETSFPEAPTPEGIFGSTVGDRPPEEAAAADNGTSNAAAERASAFLPSSLTRNVVPASGVEESKEDSAAALTPAAKRRRTEPSWVEAIPHDRITVGNNYSAAAPIPTVHLPAERFPKWEDNSCYIDAVLPMLWAITKTRPHLRLEIPEWLRNAIPAQESQRQATTRRNAFREDVATRFPDGTDDEVRGVSVRASSFNNIIYFWRMITAAAIPEICCLDYHVKCAKCGREIRDRYKSSVLAPPMSELLTSFDSMWQEFARRTDCSSQEPDGRVCNGERSISFRSAMPQVLTLHTQGADRLPSNTTLTVAEGHVYELLAVAYMPTAHHYACYFRELAKPWFHLDAMSTGLTAVEGGVLPDAINWRLAMFIQRMSDEQ
jgi:hypothetical protein